MFQRAVSAIITAFKGILSTPSPASELLPSNDQASLIPAASTVTQYLIHTDTATSPLLMMSSIATDFAYNYLQAFMFLALLCSFLPVLPAIQHFATSVRIARDGHVRNLIANVETKDARIRELENQIQQQQKQKAAKAAQHESDVKKERSAHAKELAQLSMQLSDANAMVFLEQTKNKALKLRLENEKEEKPRQATNLRVYTRHTEHVKKIREEHAAELEAMKLALEGRHREEITTVVAQTEKRVKQEIKATLDAAVEANSENRYLRSRVALLEKRATQHNTELSRKHRECKDRIKYEAIGLESRCNTKLKVVQDESDTRQRKVEMLEEKLQSCIMKGQGLQSELERKHRETVQKSVVTTLEARVQELEHVVASKDAKINSERAAASARENELVATINANVAVYEANVAARDEKIRENINVYNSELASRDAKVANFGQIVRDKDAQMAELEMKIQVLEERLSGAEKSKPDTSKKLQQCVNKYKHEKYTSKRYRYEFSKALDKLERREDANERLRKENTSLRTGLMTASGNIKTLIQDFKILSDEVQQAAVEIHQQEWNIRNYGQTFEEDIAELKRKETLPQDRSQLTTSAAPTSPPPPVAPPSSSSHPIEPVGAPADLRKAKSSPSSPIQTRTETKEPDQAAIPTEIQVKVQRPSQTESRNPGLFPQVDNSSASIPAQGLALNTDVPPETPYADNYPIDLSDLMDVGPGIGQPDQQPMPELLNLFCDQTLPFVPSSQPIQYDDQLHQWPANDFDKMVTDEPNPAGQDPQSVPLLSLFPDGYINDFDMINWQELDMAVDPAEVFNLPFAFEQVNQGPDQTIPPSTLPYEPASNGNNIVDHTIPI
ncbi:MAG: hypothetical protein Q9225_005965 [Loekoesia sp. 1 TL-2023]